MEAGCRGAGRERLATVDLAIRFCFREDTPHSRTGNHLVYLTPGLGNSWRNSAGTNGMLCSGF